MTFKVVEIVSCESIRVSPQWDCNEKHGSIVHINGIEEQTCERLLKTDTCEKLKKMVLGAEVELKNPVIESDEAVLAYVHYEGRNIAHLVEDR